MQCVELDDDDMFVFCHKRRPPIPALFPYTTLFRSPSDCPIRKRVLSKSPVLKNGTPGSVRGRRSEEHTSELQSLTNLVCRLLLEKKNSINFLTEILHFKV